MTRQTEIQDAQKFPGFWVRIASAVVDSLGFAFVTSALLLLFLHFSESLSTEALLQLFLFAWFPGSLVANVSILAFLNARGRQSLGKRFFGLVVVGQRFQPVSFRRSLLRTVVDCSLLGLSLLLIPFTQRKRGLHDLIGGTCVIRIRPPLRRELLIAVAALICTVGVESVAVEKLQHHIKGYLQSFYIPSISMEPTLLRGDYITADTRWARTSEPRRGDIVIYESPKEAGQLVIKRIMGLPGERVSLLDSVLYINGVPLRDDPGVYRGPRHHPMRIESLEIPQGHYFVLGDNRDNSFDSRNHGPMPRSALHAKVGIVYLSVGDGYSIRWNRLGRLIR
jgi:signal peptidase I